MPGFAQIHLPFLGDHGHSCLEVKGYLGFRHEEIHLPHIFGGMDQFGNIRADEVAERGENLLDLLRFLGLESEYLILQLDDLGRLHESRLSCRGSVVNEALDLFLA